jgi:hypothetical protein
VYDFGDSWRHDLVLEAIVLPDLGTGIRTAWGTPHATQDVGGSSGYEDYLEAMADPEHEDHESMLQWPGPFDPEAFSLAAVNQQLQKRFRSVRKTASTHDPSS